MSQSELEGQKQRWLGLFRRKNKAAPPSLLGLTMPTREVSRELRPEEYYLRENLQMRTVPTIEEVAREVGVKPVQLPDVMRRRAVEISQVIQKEVATVETGYERRMDFLYRCWAATRNIPHNHPLYSFARSLDSLDTFRNTYLPNASRKVNGGLIERVTAFVESAVHPKRILNVHKKGQSWYMESTFGIYQYNGNWVYLPGEEPYGYKRYADRQVVEEARNLLATGALNTDDMYHASGSSTLEGVARQKAIVSISRARERGEPIKTGEFATYIQTETDTPIIWNANTVYAGDVREITYGKSLWFDEFPLAFGISRDKMAAFLTKSGRKVDFRYHTEVGITLGPEVPLSTITTIAADGRHRGRIEEWIKRNGLQKQVRFISLEAIKLAEAYRTKPASFWDDLLRYDPIRLPSVLRQESSSTKA